MREIEIERLVQWAYVELLKRGAVGTLAQQWDVVRDYGELLTIVDDGLQMPAGAGAPHPDALTIERAVQGLAEEVALDWREYRPLLMGDLIMLAPSDDPLASRVFSEVALVESFARQGRRPAWNVGIPSPQRMLGRNNKPVIVGECKDTHRYTLGSYCPLQYTAPTIHQLVFRRAEYLVWRGALERLVGTLRGWLLRDHRPLEPDAAAVPWLDAPSSPARPTGIPGPSSFKTWPSSPPKEGAKKQNADRRAGVP